MELRQCDQKVQISTKGIQAMAMVSCLTCENPVADTAPSCPHCGVTSPAGSARLEVKRVSRILGANVPVAVWVDSNHIGNIVSGKSITLTVTPGLHRIECRLPDQFQKERAQEIDVPAGGSLVIIVALSRWNGQPEFSVEYD